MQFVPDYEESNITSIQEFDKKIFDQFELETSQDVTRGMEEMGTHHIKFSGQYQRGKKEGKGAFQCQDTGDFYYGHFQNDMKTGYGILFIGQNNPMHLNIEFNAMDEDGLVASTKPVVYKGGFLNDQFFGEGIIKLASGNIIYASFHG
jgi:hypothetical protein